jgi:hypothetical protein
MKTVSAAGKKIRPLLFRDLRWIGTPFSVVGSVLAPNAWLTPSP